MTKFSYYGLHGTPMRGKSDTLLPKIVERFAQVALSPDHAPAKCSRMISALVTAWERRGPPISPVVPGNYFVTPSLGPIPQETKSTSSHVSQLDQLQQSWFGDTGFVSSSEAWSENPPADTNPVDSQFWESFMQNLSQSTDMNMSFQDIVTAQG